MLIVQETPRMVLRMGNGDPGEPRGEADRGDGESTTKVEP